MDERLSIDKEEQLINSNVQKQESLEKTEKTEDLEWSNTFKEAPDLTTQKSNEEPLIEEKQERISKDIQESTAEKDRIDELPNFLKDKTTGIAFREKSALVKNKDSERMKRVRKALRAYYFEKEKENGDVKGALDDLIKACDKYSFGRFRIFKRGKGKQRLEEVLRIRREAKAERERLFSGEDYIHNDASITYANMKKAEYKKRNVGKLVAASFMTFFGLTVGNLAKLITLQPLWAKRGFRWSAGHYFKDSMDLLDRTFGRTVEAEVEVTERIRGEDGEERVTRRIENREERIFDTNTSKSAKMKSKTYQAEERMIRADMESLENDMEEDDETILDNGYDNDAALKDVKHSLIEAYRIKTGGQEEINRWEEQNQNLVFEDYFKTLETELAKRSEEAEKFTRYMKEHKPESKYNMNDHVSLDIELLQARHAFTQKRIEEKGGLGSMAEELREQALKNESISSAVTEESRLDKRDAAFDETELKAALEEFEKLDLRTISFMNAVDMLKDYHKNMAVFSRIHSIHYMLFRGINRGFKLEDKKLIPLRAKFKAAFELRTFMTKMNNCAISNPEALTDPKIWEQERGYNNDDGFDRIYASLGDVEGLLARCEKQIRKEYKDRGNKIESVYEFTKAENAEGISGNLLEQKKSAYESNAAALDYMEYCAVEAQEHTYMNRVEAYNAYEKENKASEKVVDRHSQAFLSGKSLAEVKRLTDLYYGDAKDRLSYYMEWIKELKSFRIEEWDTRDIKSFYDNYDRKRRMLAIGANCTTIASEVAKALEELFSEERKQNPGLSEKSRPKLPEDFKKEFGYASLADLAADMHTLQAFTNEIQGKYDAIANIANKGYLPYFSLEELCSLDAEQMNIITERGMKIFYDKENDWNAEMDTYWFTKFSQKAVNINMQDRTRPLSEQEESEGKLQPLLTKDVDVTALFEEEKKQYHWTRLAEGRSFEPDPEELRKETLAAQKNIATVDGYVTSRKDFVSKELPDQRVIIGYVGPMAYLYNDTEEKTKERVKALSVSVDKATAEEKKALAKELEDAFSLIMSFDINELNFDDYMDFTSDEKVRTRVVLKFCFEFNALFDKYKELIDDPDSGALLNDEELREVETKKMFLLHFNNAIGKLLSNLTHVDQLTKENIHEKVDVFKMLAWTQHQFDDADPMDPAPYMVSQTRDALDEFGLYPGADMELAYESFRRKSGLAEPEHGKEILGKLNRA